MKLFKTRRRDTHSETSGEYLYCIRNLWSYRQGAGFTLGIFYLELLS